MKSLLRIEWIKVSRNRIFWFMLVIYIVALVLAFLGLQSMLENTNQQIKESGLDALPLLPTNIYLFPHVWHNLTFVARFFKIFLAVVMIILVTNEYAYNTMRQSLMTGLSRLELIKLKVLDVVILSAVSTIILLVFGFITGVTYSTDYEIWDVLRKLNYVGAYFLMLVGFLSFAMMLAFLVKKPAFTIMILLVYSYILELIPAFKYSDSFGQYLPLRSMNLLIEAPNTPVFEMLNISSASSSIPTDHIIVTLIYIGVFWSVSYLVIRNRDL
jgi:ABC-type transport system involved in multi-copper enzyme maturation permease subunit